MSGIVFNLFKKRNRGAFSGALRCPVCDPMTRTTRTGFENPGEPKLKLIERVNPYTYRFQCMRCGNRIRYETAYSDEQLMRMPGYATFKKIPKMPSWAKRQGVIIGGAKY